MFFFYIFLNFYWFLYILKKISCREDWTGLIGSDQFTSAGTNHHPGEHTAETTPFDSFFIEAICWADGVHICVLKFSRPSIQTLLRRPSDNFQDLIFGSTPSLYHPLSTSAHQFAARPSPVGEKLIQIH